jgi:hypothetical protein
VTNDRIGTVSVDFKWRSDTMIRTGTLGSSRVLEKAWTQGRHVAPSFEAGIPAPGAS